jgi:HTH-type transcriptional regulator / antitoxin HigA
LRVIAKKTLRDFWLRHTDCEQQFEAIKFRMEQMGYSQSDLAKVVGLKSRASELLNRKRKLTLEMIRKLHQSLSIPTDVLIQEY